MTDELRWGILGTGRIAGTFARGLARSRTGTLVAVGSRGQASADAFGEEHGAARRHGSYDALLGDSGVDAVYVSVLNPLHAALTIRALEAGRHVLCEKPIGMNRAEAQAMVDAAARCDRFLMEAFMYRCHPQIERLVELIRAGAIGDVRAIHCAFGFRQVGPPKPRLVRAELGGGGILDVGCYTVSMARLIAGAATGAPFADPLEVRGVGHLGADGVDEYAAALLRFPGDVMATLVCGVTVATERVVRVFGSEGSLTLPSPWVPRTGAVIVRQGPWDAPPEEIAIPFDDDLYGHEADVVAAHIDARQAPRMTWADSLGNMRVLDTWRESLIGD